MKQFFLALAVLLAFTGLVNGEDMKVGRHNIVELTDADDQVIVHYVGVECDTLQYVEDGKIYVCVTPQSSGKLRLLITIVNFETRKLQSDNKEFDCVGKPQGGDNKPPVKEDPVEEDPVEEPTEGIDLSHFLDTIGDEGHESTVIHLFKLSIMELDPKETLGTTRFKFNQVLRREIRKRKEASPAFDECDLTPFLARLHDALDNHVKKGDIKTTSEYIAALKTIGE